MKLRLDSVYLSMRVSFLSKILLTLLLIGISDQALWAAKKKKNKTPKGQKVSIARRAYEDITTRNNYYFNTDLLWKETVDKIRKSRQIDYDSLLPIYFHEKANVNAYEAEWDMIIKKMGIVMQMHDYTRWKDNAYLLLGEAHFMKGEYDKALQTFQYISTTMKGKVGQEKLAVTNKERLQMIRQMEKQRKKNAKEKQKIIEFKIDMANKEAAERKEEAQEKAEAAKEAAADKAKLKSKINKEKIKLKERYMDLKARGKKVEPTFTEYYQKNSKYAQQDTILKQQDAQLKKQKEEEKTATAPPDYSKLRLRANEDDTVALGSLDRTEDNPLADSLSAKDALKASDLSFWEKIKHKPSRPDAIIWMAKTLILQNDDESAHALIQYGQAMRKLTRKNKRDMFLVETYYYLHRGNPELAQEPLSNAIELTKKKKNKAWYLYLLAQLQEQTLKYDDALVNYKKAGKFTNDFEMAFYSQMSQARLYGKQGINSSVEQITAKLKKMVRGGKNREFADQVYYSLARVALNEGDTASAIAHLEKSIKRGSDLKQRGESYLLLSDIAFEQNRFVPAHSFMDSAITYLPAAYPELTTLKGEQASLTELAEHVTALNLQDSLLALSRLSDAELAALLAAEDKQDSKADKKRKRKESWSEGEASSNTVTGNPVAATPATTSAGGNWYFYNPELKAQGYNQFVSLWGDRALEDNWRRSTKTDFQDETVETDAEAEEVSETEQEAGGQQQKAEDTQEGFENIPRTPEAIKAVNETLASSLYNTGLVLRANLERPDKALPYFERLLGNYPASPYTAQANYNLYLAYAELGNAARAEYYRSAVLNNFAGSVYALTLQNPQNVEQARGQSLPAPTEESVYYASTYSLFTSGDYEQVLSRKKYALETYKGGKYTPQFEFLGALSRGHLNQIPELKNELGQIILKYPNTEVQKKAQEYLKYITQKEQGVTVSEETPEVKNAPAVPNTPYQMGDNNLYFMVYFPYKDDKLESYKVKLTVLSDDNYGKDKYRVSSAFIDSEQSVLLSKRFKGVDEAKKYMDLVKQNSGDIFGSANPEFFIISQTNFRTFFDSKNVELYRTFHKHYFE